MSLPRRLYKFLASLKLAVILLLLLGAVLAVATYLESVYDAKTAAHLVYGHWLFYVLLFMLGVNVLCAALIRYPWKRHQTGFVIVHLGIIVILIGSFITRIWGMEGSMTLAEGEQSRWVTVDQSMLSVQDVIRDEKGVRGGPLHAVPVEFRWRPPSETHPTRIALTEGFTAVVDRYIHNAQPVERYVPSTLPRAAAAVHVTLAAGKGAPMPEGTIMADPWLSLDAPDHQEAHLGPATLRITRASTPEALARALATAGDEPLELSDGALAIEAGGRPLVVAVAGNVRRIIPVEGTPYRIRIDRFLPFAVVGKDNRLTSRSSERVNPAVEITILDEKGEAERRLLFAKYPDFATSHHQVRPSRLKLSYTLEDPRRVENSITFVVGPDDALHARVDIAGGGSRVEPVTLGRPTPTGWRMNLLYTVEAFVPRGEAVHEYKEVRSGRNKANMPPAIRLTVEGADVPGPYWLGQGEAVTVTRGKGRETSRVAYQLAAVDVGFQIRLEDFIVGYDPGTRNAATYTSKVKVEDPARSEPYEAVVTMNEPLVHGGLTFFQASFSQDEEGGELSTFQIARDPGVPVKYAGSILLVLGIALYVFSRQPRNRSQGGAPASPASGSVSTIDPPSAQEAP